MKSFCSCKPVFPKHGCKNYTFLLLFFTLCCGHAVAGDSSFILVTYVPDSFQSSVERQNIKRGVYIDKLTITSASPDNCIKQRLHYVPTDDPVYTQEIYDRMIFAWGNYDKFLSLSSLKFVFLQTPEIIHNVQNKSIRGIAAKNDELPFFTDREPPRLFSYHLKSKMISEADIGKYTESAENIGVRISTTGNVFLRGTGLQNTQPGFIVPPKFITEHSIDCNAVWVLFVNRKDLVVLFSFSHNKKNVVVGNPLQDLWFYFSIDRRYVDTKLFGKHLISSPLADPGNEQRLHIYDLDKNCHRKFIIPPFSKLVYYSSDYVLISQPFRLLIAELRDDKCKIISNIDFPEAWYIRMAIKLPKKNCR